MLKFASAVAFSILIPAASNAAIISAFGTLSGAAENPSNASAGTGTVFVDLDDTAHTLRVQTTFSGLTGNVTVAHIHCCVTAPGNAGVATQLPTFTGFPAGGTSGSYDNTFDLTLAASWNPAFVTANGGTTAGAEAALANALRNGTSYLNIHTSSFGSGEIRAFLTPEPGTTMLLGAGLIGLLLMRRAKMAG